MAQVLGVELFFDHVPGKNWGRPVQRLGAGVD